MTTRKMFWAIVPMILLSLASTDSKTNRMREIDQIILEEARKYSVKTEIVRALLYTESEWQQFEKDGITPFRRGRDTGIGQLNDCTVSDMKWNKRRVRHDTRYNIRCSIRWLEIKYGWANNVIENESELKRINRLYDIEGYSLDDLAVRAYNGMVHSHGHVVRFRSALKNKPWERWTTWQEN